MDGALATTWTSSGATSSFENVNLSGSSGQVVEITGVLGPFEWLSIIEVNGISGGKGALPRVGRSDSISATRTKVESHGYRTWCCDPSQKKNSRPNGHVAYDRRFLRLNKSIAPGCSCAIERNLPVSCAAIPACSGCVTPRGLSIPRAAPWRAKGLSLDDAKT